MGSPLFANPDVFRDPDEWGRILFAEMDGKNAKIGIGRYDEARLVYASNAFRPAGRPLAEGRTVHLGLDLFAAVGSPVRAPADGIVKFARDNDDRVDYGPTIILEHRTDVTAPGGGPLIFYTLYGHLGRSSLAGMEPGRPIARGERIGDVGPREENGNWPPHLHFQVILDLFDECGNYPGVCRASERAVWKSRVSRPESHARPGSGGNGRSESAPGSRSSPARKKHLGPSLSVSYRRPLKIVRGFMQHLYDHTGRMFLDAVNNVPHVGHGHPRVVAAVAGAGGRAQYQHPLPARHAGPVRRTADGDAAGAPRGLLPREFGERGQRPRPAARPPLHRRPGHGRPVRRVSRAPDLADRNQPLQIRGQRRIRPPAAHPGGRNAGSVPRDSPQGRSGRGAQIRRLGRRRPRENRGGGRRPAGFIAESLLSCGGQIVLPDGYLKEAYRRVRAAGGVCLADEVQVGFGRVGSHFWGFETQGVVPDIVTMGKPIGNGFPLAAVVTTRPIADAFASGPEYFNTYGGNPVSLAAGHGRPGRPERRASPGQRPPRRRGLEGRAEMAAARPRYDRGRPRPGPFPRDRARFRSRETDAGPGPAAYVAERMREEGVLLSTDGPDRNVLKIKPPLCFSTVDAERLVEILGRILGEDPLRP